MIFYGNSAFWAMETTMMMSFTHTLHKPSRWGWQHPFYAITVHSYTAHYYLHATMCFQNFP